MERGFIRLSNDMVNAQQKISELNEAGILTENIVSGEALSEIFIPLGKGDVIFISSMKELCTSITHLFDLIREILAREAHLVSLHEPWLNTTLAAVNPIEFLNHLCDLNHEVVAHRTRMGLQQARKKGKVLGRPSGNSSPMLQKLKTCVALYKNSEMSVRNICKIAGCSPRTFYRYVHDQNILLQHRSGQGTAGNGKQSRRGMVKLPLDEPQGEVPAYK